MNEFMFIRYVYLGVRGLFLFTWNMGTKAIKIQWLLYKTQNNSQVDITS